MAAHQTLNLSEVIQRHAKYRADHPAIITEHARLTYDELEARITEMASRLAGLGMTKGDHIATVMPNCLELLVFYWTVARTGVVAVPISPLLGSAAMGKLLADSDTRAVLAHPSTAETVRTACERSDVVAPERRIIVGDETEGFRTYSSLADETNAIAVDPTPAQIADTDLFNVIYSSGTTGEPKGIMHDHFVRTMYGTLFANCFRIMPESVVLHTGAIIFNGAFVTLMPAFFQGASYVMLKAFDADAFIDAVIAHRVTHTMLVPTQIVTLLDHPRFSAENMASLKMILSLGAPLHLEHKRRLEERLPGCFHELYGITEGFVVVLDRSDFTRKPESVGIPTPLFSVRIVDTEGHDVPAGEIGEIVGRGPIMMPGYYKRPDLTEGAIRDGWLYSGDLGYMDKDGFLYLVDRKKDMIISGGVNVFPRDIEEVIVRHPAVAEVAVFGIPHPKWGETPVAAVTLHDGSEISETALRDWINDHVEARFQKVSLARILGEFPRNAAGKVLKRQLRDEFAAFQQSSSD